MCREFVEATGRIKAYLGGGKCLTLFSAHGQNDEQKAHILRLVMVYRQQSTTVARPDCMASACPGNGALADGRWGIGLAGARPA